MVEINPETRKTRKERLATVISIGVSALVHLFILVGGLQVYQWAEEGEERERLMVVRLLQDGISDSVRPSREVLGRRPSPPEAKIKEQGPELPPEESRRSEEVSDDITDGGGEIPPEEEKEEEKELETTLSVVTDLSTAAFTLSGPEVHNGTGTFWTKKNVTPGDYTATFHPVPGYKTPPISAKTLEENSRIVFVGKYTRSVEVEVIVNNVPGVSFEIRRPDGIVLGMTQPGRAFFEDLPLGAYRIIFHGVAGYLTPPPQIKTLKEGGRLAFVGSYLPERVGRPAQRGKREERLAKPGEGGLDHRVQMVVKSYPPSAIEEDFDYIRYPEIIIGRSSFQKGWCQVYLVLTIDDRGRVTGIEVQRPGKERQGQFGRLIATVQEAVKSWRFAEKAAEVHVDVRFYVE
jgi:hypothetical protein